MGKLRMFFVVFFMVIASFYCTAKAEEPQTSETADISAAVENNVDSNTDSQVTAPTDSELQIDTASYASTAIKLLIVIAVVQFCILGVLFAAAIFSHIK